MLRRRRRRARWWLGAKPAKVKAAVAAGNEKTMTEAAVDDVGCPEIKKRRSF